ncbi:anti-anti-sigma factor [Actinoplanes octamycinicus]|uniref:Anti-anti-sigma factor n=1 Tax=Actinoplanes octamycinicus TaxID=135948 RepID=A0A7W7H218_9ACTN|nr:MEDS domain-containing protein [Actinoplanes octamycinicus]MBB4742556.1 anti-anti-sigma factor [Actinoplanes octamycinicus]GIE60894.1 hypothetical protein Aoc01nite_62960 [Actinoplanes octamycinicus]
MPLLERLSPGDHVCLTVDDDMVRREALTEVIESGLRYGCRVVCCGAGEEVFGFVKQRAGAALASGALRVPSLESSYLRTGVFDPVVALSYLRREVDEARDAGYPGVYLLTDMSWAGRPVPGIAALPEYEAQANTVFAEGYALAVCAYDPRVFDVPALRGFAQAHLATVGTGASFDPAGALRMRRTRDPFGLCLEGEADLLNQAALSAVVGQVLDSLPAGVPAAVVDLSSVRFMDTAAARVLLLAWQRAAGRLQFVGQPALMARLFQLHGAGQPAGNA